MLGARFRFGRVNRVSGLRHRIRYRRRGYEDVELKVPRGYRGDKMTLANSKEFLTAYLAAGSQPVAEIAPGEKRAAHGSVEWLCVEHLASLDFTARPKSMRTSASGAARTWFPWSIRKA